MVRSTTFISGLNIFAVLVVCTKIKQPPEFLQNITNATYGKQINLLGTSVKILLGFLTKCYVTLTHNAIPIVSGCHVAWYISFWMLFFLKKKKKKRRQNIIKYKNYFLKKGELGWPPRLAWATPQSLGHTLELNP